MSRGKHSSDYNDSFYEPKYEPSTEMYNDYDDEDEGEFNKKPIIIVAVIIIVIALIIGGIIYFKNKDNDKESKNTVATEETEKMISTYEGYNVLGKIVIDNISVDQYILDSTLDAALEKGVIKLYGDKLNGYGNFCIAGHNKDGIFSKLSELKEGDYFTIINPSMNKTNYKITSITTCEPDNLECLLQDDTSVKITLITCDNLSTKRLIVQAEKTNEKIENTNQSTNTTEENK